MSEYRFDPLHQTWALVAQERSGRPADFRAVSRVRADRDCPFCLGFESETPPEILRLGQRDYSDLRAGAADVPAVSSPRPLRFTAADLGQAKEPWWVRVVPNRYPAVKQASRGRRSSAGDVCIASSVAREHACELAAVGPAVGRHEVVIESPRHCGRVTEADPAILPLMFAAYRSRLAEFAADGRLAYASVFKNVGPEAGASLEHLHSQIVALPMVPPHVETTWHAAWEHRRRERTCMTCQLIEQEISAGVRVVAETEGLVAWCPFASRFAYEVCIAPKNHSAQFRSVDDAGLLELASLVRRVLGRIEQDIRQPQYNLVLQTAPFSGDVEEALHWRLEILPRTAKAAGFEWGTQCFINAVAPEMAADFYREGLSDPVSSSDSAACDAEFR
jgi:UDPglucose--hexose-1-phosphate uridylyltransferase